MVSFMPLGLTIAIIILAGIVFPFFLGYFIDIETIPTSIFAYDLIDIINDGFELDVIPFTDWGTFNINPFSWLGDTMQNKLTESIAYMGLLPDFVLISLILFCVVSIIYTVVGLARGT